ncbi:MAG: NACHT domain-containing protein, partial [Proteobacteria bacterium]|nr:NACHT domain-containing protein [Pseudomonadota bacterium]
SKIKGTTIKLKLNHKIIGGSIDGKIKRLNIKCGSRTIPENEFDYVINIFHHPLNWLWPVDRRICRKYLNNTISLSGHLHDVEGGYHDDLDGRFYQFQAGGTYVGSESTYPNRYQHITFNWKKKDIKLNFRKFNKEGRKWCIEAEKGDDGEATFKLKESVKSINDNFVGIPEIPEIYLKWLKEHCAYMEVDKLLDKSNVIQINLPEIFIPLYTMARRVDNREFATQRADELGIDIEELISRNEYLLVEGHPGSGKTTLFKHLAYSLAQRESIEGLDNFLPVLILIKDLKGFFDDNKDIKPKSSTAEALLSFHFNTTENGLDIETLKLFCNAKKVIFLLDGLDEIKSTHREIVVNSFADFRLKYEGIKIILSGRPHGLVGAAVNRFGK